MVLILVLLAVNLALIGAVTTSAASHSPYNGEWDGESTLRTTATTSDASESLGIDTTEYESVSANGTVAIIVAPQENYTGTEAARIRQFLQQGGTLVVASEDNQTNRLLSDLGVETRIDGHVVRDEQEHYRGPALPVATNVREHPLTEGVESLTLNYGSILVRTQESDTLDSKLTGDVLINTSGFAYLDRNGNRDLDAEEEVQPRPVVVAEEIGEGRVVVVSDGSVFTNAMLDRDGNEQFATNLVSAHKRVLLDYSHGSPLPPLVYALVIVRETPLLQFFIGIGSAGLVVGWIYRESLPLPGIRAESRQPEIHDRPISLDEEDLTESLTDRHPEWDDERVERVTKAIIRGRQESDDNE